MVPPAPSLPPASSPTNHFSLRYPTSFAPYPPPSPFSATLSFVLLRTYTCSEARASIFRFTWTLIVHPCAHRRAERRQRMQNRRTRRKKRRRERGETRARTNRSVDRRLERRVRRNGRGREGGWPFAEHGGPSMDVRRSPWRHTCTSPRYTSESEQPYKVAGLRFNPKFISSISKGLSRAPRPSEREADEDDASPSPTLSPVSSRFSPLFFSSPSSQERRNARRCTGASRAHHYITTPISPSLLYPRCTGVRSRV